MGNLLGVDAGLACEQASDLQQHRGLSLEIGQGPAATHARK
jgi:hypothetical protein